ncbi:MAG: hypothetical protein COT14_02705 [Candidatus Diapherotrites archaeon CG08_land_8_20_14_0_20_30_16]|nr:MAG: hypothetical protein COT14_02705 [Candidatus Diapherotrites archaeon CG08_land_8_20_14_0_20_30_16]
MTSLSEKAKKAVFLTSNLKIWLVIFILGIIGLFIALFLGLYPYLSRVMTFLSTRVSRLFSFDTSLHTIIASIIFVIGGLAIIYSAYKIYKFFSGCNDSLFENVYVETKLSKAKKIVTLGGGTGQYTILTGLKEYTSNISAIISTMDSGGSSQLLKTEFGVLPPGDLRNAIISLSTLNDKQKKIFTLRFDTKSSLKGHTIGNLILARLDQDLGTKEACNQFSDLLRIRGRVLPVTFDKCELVAKLKDDKMIIGEDNIGKFGLGIKELGLSTKPKLNPEAKEAIKDADAIVIGPGDLFTSVLPNLLVPELCNEIKKSKAKKIYVCNVMTNYPETHGFKAENYLEWIEKFIDLDFVLFNTKQPSKEQLKKCLEEKKYFVEPAVKDSTKFIKEDLINEKNPNRHDSKKLADAVIRLSKIN